MRRTWKNVAVVAIVAIGVGLSTAAAGAERDRVAGPRSDWSSIYQAVLGWGQDVARWMGLEEPPGHRAITAATEGRVGPDWDPDGSNVLPPEDGGAGLLTEPGEPRTDGEVGPDWDPNG